MLPPEVVAGLTKACETAEAIVKEYSSKETISASDASTLLRETAAILAANPDVPTLWALRRRALISDEQQTTNNPPAGGFSTQLMAGDVFEKERLFVTECAGTKPLKAYALWHHLVWILCAHLHFVFTPIRLEAATEHQPQRELWVPDSWTSRTGSQIVRSIVGRPLEPDKHQKYIQEALRCVQEYERLCADQLQRDSRNFHVWAFLLLVHKLMAALLYPNDPVKETAHFKELQREASTAELERCDFNNPSAIHVRMNVITVTDEELCAELAWLKHTIYEDPGREDVWRYVEHLRRLSLDDKPFMKTVVVEGDLGERLCVKCVKPIRLSSSGSRVGKHRLEWTPTEAASNSESPLKRKRSSVAGVEANRQLRASSASPDGDRLIEFEKFKRQYSRTWTGALPEPSEGKPLQCNMVFQVLGEDEERSLSLVTSLRAGNVVAKPSEEVVALWRSFDDFLRHAWQGESDMPCESLILRWRLHKAFVHHAISLDGIDEQEELRAALMSLKNMTPSRLAKILETVGE